MAHQPVLMEIVRDGANVTLSLNKTGVGTLTLGSGNSTYSGGTNITGGTIVLDNVTSGAVTKGPLGRGNVTLAAGGTLDEKNKTFSNNVTGAGTSLNVALALNISQLNFGNASYSINTSTSNLTNTFNITSSGNEVNRTAESISVTYSSSDSNVASVNASTGAVTIKTAGNVTITANYNDSTHYYGNQSTYTLNIARQNATISLQMPQSICLQQIAAIHLL